VLPILAGAPVTLSEVFRGFSQSLQDSFFRYLNNFMQVILIKCRPHMKLLNYCYWPNGKFTVVSLNNMTHVSERTSILIR
jgi:hypothetical protein